MNIKINKKIYNCKFNSKFNNKFNNNNNNNKIYKHKKVIISNNRILIIVIKFNKMNFYNKTIVKI